VGPSVVSITSSRTVSGGGMLRFGPDEGFQFPFGPSENVPVRGLGSGAIIRSDGYIVTNNHVIEGAERIWVAFPGDKESTVEATLVGADAETDLAVIKVDRTGLPAIEMGDAKTLKVGEWAIAIGSPFGLPQTMTVGVISALGRSIRAPNSEFSMEHMIQTDAAINRGNSGGPLVDIAGRLIGINTIIFSENGGSQGVGFAIPVDVVRFVSDALIKDGKISRGWLGIVIQDVSPEIAEVFRAREGAIIADVLADSPADKAGLKQGDVVTAVDGQPTPSAAALRDAVARSGPDKRITLTVLRDGKEMRITAKTALKPTSKAQARPSTSRRGRARSSSALGMEVSPLPANVAQRLGLEGGRGTYITRVDPNSAAAQAGMREGLVLKAINREPIREVSDFERVAAKLGKGSKVVALVQDPQDGTTFYIAFTL